MKKYFDFRRKATREEFWWMFLLLIFARLILGFSLAQEVNPLITYVIGIGTLLTIWTFLATFAARIRATGNNAWWVLTSFIPLINLASFVVFGSMKKNKPTKSILN